MTAHAIILAAGFGSRLQAQEGHKLLALIGEQTLLQYHLDNFKRVGVEYITVVTGYRHEALEAAVAEATANQQIHVSCAYNPRFEGSNGISVLAGIEGAQQTAAARALPFWLTMADHIFEPTLFDQIATQPAFEPHVQGALYVDYKLETIYDMPDATKVAFDEHGQLSKIGKEIEPFDAVDVGLFWCARGFVQALRDELDARQDCSTSDAVRRLCQAKQFSFPDVLAATWQDVDTPGARAHAETLIKRWRG